VQHFHNLHTDPQEVLSKVLTSTNHNEFTREQSVSQDTTGEDKQEQEEEEATES